VLLDDRDVLTGQMYFPDAVNNLSMRTFPPMQGRLNSRAVVNANGRFANFPLNIVKLNKLAMTMDANISEANERPAAKCQQTQAPCDLRMPTNRQSGLQNSQVP
jgi:hypothetical protein